MSEQYEPRAPETASPAGGHARAGVIDLMAFLGTLVFAGGLTLLVDRTGQVSARLVFAGAAGLAAGCVTAWRRLRRPALRRWRSGQAIYHGRRVTLVSAWGAQGQPLPTIEPPGTVVKNDGKLTDPAAPPKACGRSCARRRGTSGPGWPGPDQGPIQGF